MLKTGKGNHHRVVDSDMMLSYRSSDTYLECSVEDWRAIACPMRCLPELGYRSLTLSSFLLWIFHSYFYLYGWDAGDKLKVHVEIWDVVVLVSSGRNWLCICNSEMIPRSSEGGMTLEENWREWPCRTVIGRVKQ